MLNKYLFEKKSIYIYITQSNKIKQESKEGKKLNGNIGEETFNSSNRFGY